MTVSSVKENRLELELESELETRGPEPNNSQQQRDPLSHAKNMADSSVDSLASKVEGTHLDSPKANGSGQVVSSVDRATTAVRFERSESELSTDGEPSCNDESCDQFSASEVVASALRGRKSCLRRTSSTSTDEEVEVFNGSPDSPSKNVRFNLKHQIRVFSNKKDKKKRKLEQRLKAESKKAFESAKAVAQGGEPISPTAFEGSWPDLIENTHNENTDSPTRTAELNEKQREVSPPELTNDLIFELDD